MPELGQTVSEGQIIEWRAEVGDEIELGQVLFVVETDKAELEVESAAEGMLLEIVVPAGQVVETGAVVAHIGDPGEPT